MPRKIWQLSKYHQSAVAPLVGALKLYAAAAAGTLEFANRAWREIIIKR